MPTSTRTKYQIPNTFNDPMCKWFCTTFSLGAPVIYSTDWLLIMSAFAKTYKARAKRRNFLRDEPNSNLSRPKLS